MIKADLLVTNANIITLDAHHTIARSLAVTNGKITRLWRVPEPPRSEIEITRRTEILNLQGATMLPGFIDTHNHILEYALSKSRVNCSSPPNKDIDDILTALKKQADTKAEGDWIIGYGYDDTLLKEQRHPTKFDLDQAVPNHPVFITHICGHVAIANSKAMAEVGLEKFDQMSRSLFGMYFGEYNGVFFEQAIEPFYNVIPLPEEKDLLALLGEAAEDYLATGITTSTDASVGAYFGTDEFTIHCKASSQKHNPMRMKLMIMHNLFQEGAPLGHYDANELNLKFQERSNGFVELDSVKMFQDGSIQGLTGALRKPYYNDQANFGDLIHNQQAFNEEILNLHNRGYRIAIHGNGDRAIGSILDGYEYALQNDPRVNHRHRIEHVQTATPEDLDKMKELQIAASFFINHVYYWGDRHQHLFLGPTRANRINPIQDAIERKLLFTLHADCPVTPISPLFSVWAAVNRLTKEGDILGPSQRCDVTTALKAMTIYGATLNFEEDRFGTIEVGKHADFTILEKDPTTVNPIDIKDIPIISTIIDGQVVFKSE